MVDAGAIYSPLKYTIAPKPDGTRRPGEWISRYAARHMVPTGSNRIDFLMLTHFHLDHIGEFTPELPWSANGAYRLTGAMDVAEAIPIQRVIDRGFPHYSYPQSITDPTLRNYIDYIRFRSQHAQPVEKFRAGSAEQIVLVFAPEKYTDFKVRNLAVNGEVWTGNGDEARPCFPPIATLGPRSFPTENMCCAAIRLQYGRFSYYTGGDLECDTGYENVLWRDIESPVARAAGRVTVAITDHHGYVNAVGPAFVRALRPRAFINFGWDSAHPTIPAMANMLSRELYPDEREIYATAVKPENLIVTRALEKLKSSNGHVVIRVPPGGEHFSVVILDNSDESDWVIGEFGPFASA
jgi:hypothetical protein